MPHARALISASSKKEATLVLASLIKKRLVAGGMITAGTSQYWWKNKLTGRREFNISAFTSTRLAKKIIAEVERLHGDETPIVAIFKIDRANRDFLKWIDDEIQPRRP